MRFPFTLNKYLESLTILFLITSVVAAWYFYGHFPDHVPTHYNLEGVPDQYSGRAFAAWFVPVLLIVLYIGMLLLPLIDPKKERYREFSHPYQVIRLIIVMYLTGIYFASSLYALGAPINIADVSTIGVGSLFLIIGNFMPKFKPNWFVGIRTPWTLSDEEIWQKTHHVGGWLFFLSGLALVFSIFTPSSWRWIGLMILVGIDIIGTVGYSYYLWHRKQASLSAVTPPAQDSSHM